VGTEFVGEIALEHVEPAGARRPVPLVLVHGLWGDTWVWDRWMPHAVSRGWDTWAIHHRGRGGTWPTVDLGKVSLRDLVADLREVLRHLGPAAVVGFSMGGLVAQLASDDPNLRAVVYLNTVPPGGMIAFNPWMARRLAKFLPRILAGRVFVPTRSDADVLLYNRSPSATVEQYYAKAIADSGTIAREIMLGSCKVDASKIGAPRLIVSASEDRISPPSLQRKLIDKYGAEHTAFPGLDHMNPVGPDWQGPADATLDWLERTVGD